jgi:hypothetical protein
LKEHHKRVTSSSQAHYKTIPGAFSRSNLKFCCAIAPINSKCRKMISAGFFELPTTNGAESAHMCAGTHKDDFLMLQAPCKSSVLFWHGANHFTTESLCTDVNFSPLQPPSAWAQARCLPVTPAWRKPP